MVSNKSTVVMEHDLVCLALFTTSITPSIPHQSTSNLIEQQEEAILTPKNCLILSSIPARTIHTYTLHVPL